MRTTILASAPTQTHRRVLLEEGETHCVPGTTKREFVGPGEVVLVEFDDGGVNLISHTARIRDKQSEKAANVAPMRARLGHRLRSLVVAVTRDRELNTVQLVAFVDSTLGLPVAEKLTVPEHHLLRERVLHHLELISAAHELNRAEAHADLVCVEAFLKQLPVQSPNEIKARVDLARRVEAKLYPSKETA